MLTKNLMTWVTVKNTYEQLEDKVEKAFGERHYRLEKEEKLHKAIKNNEALEVAE